MEASGMQLDNYSSRVDEAATRNIIDQDEYQVLEDFRRIRNEVANEEDWYETTPLDEEANLNDETMNATVHSSLQDGISLWEQVIGIEPEDSILDQESGSWEQTYFSQNSQSARNNIIRLAEETCREEGSPLNPVAGVIAYNSLRDQVPDRIEEETGISPGSGCLQYAMQDEDGEPLQEANQALPDTPRDTSYDFMSSLENLRMLFAHNVESYSVLPDSEATEIIRYGIETANRL